MSETRIHPETGKVLVRGVREQIVRFGSLARKLEVPGWYPDDDSDSVHSGLDLAKSDEVYKQLRLEYAQRIKAIRKKLGLTQEEAGRVIGGGARAFQKYERGAVSPSDAAIGLIELLARYPHLLRTLESLRENVEEPVMVAEEMMPDNMPEGPF